MFIMSDLNIPKAQLNELKSLSIASIKCLLKSLIDCVTDVEFEGCDSTSRRFDDWVETLTKNQIMKLTQYVLSILDYLTED